MANPNIYILGAGALGLGLARQLIPHVRLHFVCDATRNCATLSKKVEVLCSLAQSQGRALPKLEEIENLKNIPPNSQLWLCCKAYDLVKALQLLRAKLDKIDAIVLCSNGLFVYQEVVHLIGDQVPIVRALWSTGFIVTEECGVVQSGELQCTLSCAGHHRLHRDKIARLLAQMGTKTILEDSVIQAEWNKVVANCVVNSICSILNSKNSAILESSDLKSLASELLAEIREIALHDNIDLSALSDNKFFKGLENYAQNLNSTLLDRKRGKTTEVSYTLGRVLKVADTYGVSAPIARTLYRILCID